MTTKLKKREEIINAIDTRLGDSLEYCNNVNDYAGYDIDFDTFDELRDILEKKDFFNIDVIYYARAIDFLRENDSSLHNSIELVNDMGYTLENINSELLASLLASDMLRETFNELESDTTIETLFEQLSELE